MTRVFWHVHLVIYLHERIGLRRRVVMDTREAERLSFGSVWKDVVGVGKEEWIRNDTGVLLYIV